MDNQISINYNLNAQTKEEVALKKLKKKDRFA